MKEYRFRVDRKPGFMQRQKKTLTGRVEGQLCPSCAAMLDGFTCVTEEARPQTGDFTVCLYCASVLQWCEEMKLKPSSLMEVPVHLRMNFAQLVQVIQERRRSHGSD